MINKVIQKQKNKVIIKYYFGRICILKKEFGEFYRKIWYFNFFRNIKLYDFIGKKAHIGYTKKFVKNLLYLNQKYDTQLWLDHNMAGGTEKFFYEQNVLKNKNTLVVRLQKLG